MESERYQKELFEFEEPRKRKSRFSGIFRTPNFAIALTAEKIIFIIIGMVMLLVIFFALGVEKGKSLADRMAAIRAKPASNITPKERIKAQQPVPVQRDADNPYTIVAAAFSKQEFALKEANRLKNNGMDAFVYFSDPYYLACVGSFANKDSASKALSRVRQAHRDAYIRLK